MKNWKIKKVDYKYDIAKYKSKLEKRRWREAYVETDCFLGLWMKDFSTAVIWGLIFYCKPLGMIRLHIVWGKTLKNKSKIL